MNRKRIPPEPPPSHVDRMVQAHHLETGHSYLAVARLVLHACRTPPIRTTTRTVTGQRARAPPVAETDRTDGWLHRPESPARGPQSQTPSRKGSHVQHTHSITRPVRPETSALQRTSLADRMRAP